MEARRIIGSRAEQRVVEYLTRRGWLVRDRNVTCRYGELDVVAEQGDVLAFVEVRMRSSDRWGEPSASVVHRKQRRVVKAAVEYCQKRGLFERVIRFDVASLIGDGPGGSLEYIEGAFEAWF